jgi:carboxyl-terminal processing protease
MALRLAALMLVACARGGTAPAPAPVAPDTAAAVETPAAAITQAEALAVFDTAWSRIERSHYDSTFGGLDWHGVRAELRPRANQARTTAALRAVIEDMLGRLGESHHGLLPRDVADALDPQGDGAGGAGRPGDAGMELRLAEGSVVVWRVDPRGPAAAAGIRSGWIVQAIDARRTADALRTLAQLDSGAERRIALTRFLYSINALLHGTVGSPLALELLDARDRPVRAQLVRREQPGEPVRLGNLPTMLARLESERIDHAAGCTGVIRFNVWMAPVAARFDSAVDRLRACDGFVIDLRGNPGGVAGMVMGFAGHFLDDPVPLGTLRSRAGTIRFVANPRRTGPDGRLVSPYAGRLAILTDAMTASTSEIFARGLQAVGRARVFGETSAGQALPAVVTRLPNGDVLMYVVADLTDPEGKRVEGVGVRPDVVLPVRRDDLLAGRDAPLDAALRWITQQSGNDREG